jgi:hypothetical protein
MGRNLPQKVRSLDGEYVFISETENHVFVASDRFASKPLFYLTEGDKLIVSFVYASLWEWFLENNRLTPDPLAFFEFLHFQRLFGETTLDKVSKTLPPAAILSFESNTSKTHIDHYWTPNFTKRPGGRKTIAKDLADAVRASVAVKTSDATNYSLLLSGGMDSRVALGGFPEASLPHCITIGETENNEVDVARSLAKLVAAPHTYVSRSPDHYAHVFSKAVATGGGMYSFQHGHFFDLDIPKTDLILHGHGFDYFFQGMYLPATRRKILGRPTRSYALDSIQDDIIDQYIHQAKYRLKGISPLDLLLPDITQTATANMRANLESVLSRIEDESADAYDQWDYLTTSSPGRHYTYLNLLSANTLAEQRTIAFTNDILDIYYSTPPDVRHGTELLAETIKRLNPQLLEVRNANTNMRPDLSAARLTLKSWSRGLKRRLGAKDTLDADPAVKDRSWPSDSDIANCSNELTVRIENLPESNALNSLNMFDPSKIKKLVSSTQSGDQTGASALLTLLTIDEFLSA